MTVKESARGKSSEGVADGDRFLDGQIWYVSIEEVGVRNPESARTLVRRRAAELKMIVKVRPVGSTHVIVQRTGQAT